MPVAPNGAWSPSVYPKQVELMDACLPGPKNLVLCNGPRRSGKTFACHHAVIRHAWETDRANISLLTVTQSVGVDSGVWQHLTEIFLPEWIDDGNFGMEWVKKPYVQNTTKKPACEVTNKYGNVSRFSLESLKVEDEVEARFKGKGFSCIWVNELSKFKHHKTFVTLKQCLNRLPHLKPNQNLFLADTNPDLDLGELSWIYKLWYEFRMGDDDVCRRLFPDRDPDIMRPLKESLNLVEFSVDDNLSMDDKAKKELMADFAHDQDLLAAYFYGKWVTASSDALFFKVFRPDFHVIGEQETASNPEPDVMVPEENCSELILGLDPGGTNCAASIMEMAYRKDDRDQDVPIIKIIDELVVVGEDFDLRDFVEELVRKMKYWEEMLGRDEKRMTWRCWSDRSAFDMKVPFSDRFWHQHIFGASDGKISLMAAERGKGSVRARIDLFRKLLFEERLFISRSKCPSTIQMCKSLKPGTQIVAPIQRGSPHKHIFDAATYAIASELYDELNREIMQSIRMKRDIETGSENSLISVALR